MLPTIGIYPPCDRPHIITMISTDDCLKIQCPINFVLEILGGKWSILILRELFQGERRTSQLLAALPGISTKTLTQRLRNLEQHGLLERRVYAEVPPRVDYRLTPRGLELQPVLGALHQVGLQWLDQPKCQCPAVR
jgi:DNA-binding HxlR family transcriptional regulator